MSAAPALQQLHMLWPAARLEDPPAVTLPAGYILRIYSDGDWPGWARVMELAGFGAWEEEKLRATLLKVLPDGFFMAVDQEKGQIVAAAMATHNPLELHPFGGELGWVAGDPAHAGRGLGMAVCAAVTARFLRAGYRRIYLRTDDFRLPAIKTYLRLGYEPFLYANDMPARWRDICERLGVTSYS
jgi:mycothiol synthase